MTVIPGCNKVWGWNGGRKHVPGAKAPRCGWVVPGLKSRPIQEHASKRSGDLVAEVLDRFGGADEGERVEAGGLDGSWRGRDGGIGLRVIGSFGSQRVIGTFGSQRMIGTFGSQRMIGAICSLGMVGAIGGLEMLGRELGFGTAGSRG